jgi:hypothetical protein
LSRVLLESTKWWILIRRRGRIHNSFVVLFPLRACLLLVLMKPPALLAASKMPTADAAIDATTQTLWRTIWDRLTHSVKVTPKTASEWALVDAISTKAWRRYQYLQLSQADGDRVIAIIMPQQEPTLSKIVVLGGSVTRGLLCSFPGSSSLNALGRIDWNDC